MHTGRRTFLALSCLRWLSVRLKINSQLSEINYFSVSQLFRILVLIPRVQWDTAFLSFSVTDVTMKKCICHSSVKVLPLNIFIILFSSKNKMVFLEGCSLNDWFVAFLVIPFLNIVIHSDSCFLSSSLYLMCIIFYAVLYRLFNGNVKKIPRTIMDSF